MQKRNVWISIVQYSDNFGLKHKSQLQHFNIIHYYLPLSRDL